MSVNGQASESYGLINTDTANLVGEYASEAAALRDVAEDVRKYGANAPAVRSLALFRWYGAEDEALIAEGEALVERALGVSTAGTTFR